jgi:uncharacterized repeat protein (TIGR01451 family)
MALPRFLTVFGLFALLLSALFVSPGRQAAAQDASDLVVTLKPNVTRAKIGDIVEFTVRVENKGTETFTNLSVSLGLPDALDARSVYCPFNAGSGNGVTDCEVGNFEPGSVTDVLFYVHVGSRTANGTVSAFVSADGISSILVQIPPIKIVGSPKFR